MQKHDNEKTPTDLFINTHAEPKIWYDYTTSKPKEEGEYLVCVSTPGHHLGNTQTTTMLFKGDQFIHPKIKDADSKVLYWFGRWAVLKEQASFNFVEYR